MEGLEKLQQVQSIINLLHSVGVSDANADSDRFLADFALLLVTNSPFYNLALIVIIE